MWRRREIYGGRGIEAEEEERFFLLLLWQKAGNGCSNEGAEAGGSGGSASAKQARQHRTHKAPPKTPESSCSMYVASQTAAEKAVAFVVALTEGNFIFGPFSSPITT